jgi:hypothetical protein
MANPLTKKTQNGLLYARPANIEAAIDEASLLDLDALTDRAQIANRQSSLFLPLECLVHFIRDARRTGNEKAMNALMPRLLGRCSAILRAKIPGDYLPNAEDVREEILGEFAVLFAEDGCPGDANVLDFFECRFNSAFLTFRTPFIDRERARTDPLVAVPAQDEHTGDFTDDEFLSEVLGAFQQPATQFDHALRQSLLKAIDTLAPDQCKAVMLYYFFGYPLESEDPSIETVASRCGVTPRTIRNRLSRAVATLTKMFKQEGKTCL